MLKFVGVEGGTTTVGSYLLLFGTLEKKSGYMIGQYKVKFSHPATHMSGNLGTTLLSPMSLH